MSQQHVLFAFESCPYEILASTYLAVNLRGPRSTLLVKRCQRGRYKRSLRALVWRASFHVSPTPPGSHSPALRLLNGSFGWSWAAQASWAWAHLAAQAHSSEYGSCFYRLVGLQRWYLSIVSSQRQVNVRSWSLWYRTTLLLAALALLFFGHYLLFDWLRMKHPYLPICLDHSSLGLLCGLQDQEVIWGGTNLDLSSLW